MNPNAFQWKRFNTTSAGTTDVLGGRTGVLHNIVIPANKTGTADFYDASGTAGTASTNLFFSIPNTVGTIPTNVLVDTNLKNGLVVITGGTVDFTISYT